MFKRFIYDEWTMIFPFAAFIIAACIFGFFVWRACRMRRTQTDRFAHLPFNDESASRP